MTRAVKKASGSGRRIGPIGSADQKGGVRGAVPMGRGAAQKGGRQCQAAQERGSKT
jgi:hypothetical protein